MQRRAAEPPCADGFDPLRVGRELVPGDRRVGGHHPVEAHVFDDRQQVFELGVRQIGRDLHEEPGVVRPTPQCREQRVRVPAGLHRPQPRGVRRRDVDDHEVGDPAHGIERGQIVGRRPRRRRRRRPRATSRSRCRSERRGLAGPRSPARPARPAGARRPPRPPRWVSRAGSRARDPQEAGTGWAWGWPPEVAR